MRVPADRPPGSNVNPLKEASAHLASRAKRLNALRLLPFCFLLSIFASNSVWALDSHTLISQYGHTAWRIQDGYFSGQLTAIAQTGDGYLWVGTRAGLLRFDGARFVLWTPPAGQQPPSLRIRSLLGARDGSLWIGTDSGLNHWVNQKLPNLNLQGIIASTIEDRIGAIWFICFSIAPALDQTNWFRLLCIASAVLILVVLYRLRVRQIARSISARFDERLAERTRMARDLHDTFLQTIQGSKLVVDDALDGPSDSVRLRHAMERLSEWLGQATREGRAALNSLRTSTTETNDLAKALQRATEDCLVPGSMAVNFSVIGDAKTMLPIVRDEIYRIGYETIRNACAHSSASQLEVELTYGQDLSLRIADNGVGIDSAVSEKEKAGYFGLQKIQERAGRIGGKLALLSSSDSGTEIKLSVPGGVIFQKEDPVRQTLLTKIRKLVSQTKHRFNLD